MTKTAKVTKAEAEQVLGRPCPHEYAQAHDYCYHCANSVAGRRMKQRSLDAMDALVASRRQVSQ